MLTLMLMMCMRVLVRMRVLMLLIMLLFLLTLLLLFKIMLLLMLMLIPMLLLLLVLLPILMLIRLLLLLLFIMLTHGSSFRSCSRPCSCSGSSSCSCPCSLLMLILLLLMICIPILSLMLLVVLMLISRAASTVGLVRIGWMLWGSPGVLFGRGRLLALVCIVMGLGLSGAGIAAHLGMPVVAQVCFIGVMLGHAFIWPLLTLIFFCAAYRSPLHPRRYA